MTNQPKEQWEERFDEEFRVTEMGNDVVWLSPKVKTIKDFIAKEKALSRREVLEKVRDFVEEDQKRCLEVGDYSRHNFGNLLLDQLSLIEKGV